MDLVVQNYGKDKREILHGFDRESFVENWQENDEWSISLNIDKTGANEVAFGLLEYESSILWNGEEFIVKSMTDSANGQFISKDITATHVYYTVQDGYQYDELTGTRSIKQLLTHVFDGENGNLGFTWEVIDPDGVFKTVEQENFGNGNYLSLIEQILSDYNAVVVPKNKHLVFKPKSKYGEKIEEQIRYKYNTNEVSFSIDTFDLKTQIKGFGKYYDENNDEGKPEGYAFEPITYTSPEVEKWGVRIQTPVNDERYTVEENMLMRLKEDLQDYPTITGSVSLSWIVNPSKGDYVPFVYEPLGIKTYIQVVGISEYPLIPNKPPEITLSNTVKTMTGIITQMIKKGAM